MAGGVILDHVVGQVASQATLGDGAAAVNIHDTDVKGHVLKETEKGLYFIDEPSEVRGEHIFRWMIYLTVLFSGFVIMATFGLFKWKKMLTYWDHDASRVVRGYLQKLAVYDLMNLLWLWLLHHFVFKRNMTEHGVEPTCFEPGAYYILVILILIITMIAGIVRYLGVGFAHSESYSFNGKDIFNPKKPHVFQGFNASTSVAYSRVISPYLFVGLFVCTISVIYFCLPLAENYTEPIHKAKICLAGWPANPEGFDRMDAEQLLVNMSFLLQPLICAMLTENVYFMIQHGVRTSGNVPGYYYVLHSPFVGVTLTTTWTTWIGILVLVYLNTFTAGGAEFLTLMMFFLMLDSFFLAVVCFITGRSNKVSRM